MPRKALPVYRAATGQFITAEFEVVEVNGQAWVTLDTAIEWENAHRLATRLFEGSSRISRRRLRLFKSDGTAKQMPTTLRAGNHGFEPVRQTTAA